jgi:hypothetical protein
MVHTSELWQLLPPHQQPANLPDHWQEADLQVKLYEGQSVPQLLINGDPMPHAYVPPDCSDFKFKPGAGGNSIWEHLPRLALLASQAAVIVEIGIASMTGSTHAFDLGLQESEAAPGRKLHIGIDIHDSVYGPWVPRSPFWHYVKGDSREPQTAYRVGKLLDHLLDGDGIYRQVIDILYIDTVHEYEFLKAELANWLPMIGPNTLVLFHDTHRGGSRDRMTDAIEEMVNNYVGDETSGALQRTHQYIQFSETCEGLGGLVPKAGWPK